MRTLSAGLDKEQLISYFTSSPGHAEHLARQAKLAGKDRVIVIGGDGTVNEVINGLLYSADGQLDTPDNIPLLGVVPTGSANIFARALGFSGSARKAVRQLVAALKAGSETKVNIGSWHANGSQGASKRRFFAVNAGFGIDADVIGAMDSLRDEGVVASPGRYFRLSFRLWRETLKFPPRIRVTSGSVDLRSVPLAFVSVTDPWAYLGSIPVRTVPRPHGVTQRGLSMFAVESLLGWRVAASAAGLLLPWFSRWAGSVRHVVTDAERISLSLSSPQSPEEPQRGFQVDGEYQDVSPYFTPGEDHHVELRFFGQALRVAQPYMG